MAITRLTKRAIAETQLLQAIASFPTDPISAITLAGAAEEILGVMARRAGEDNFMDELLEIDKAFHESEHPGVPWDPKAARRLLVEVRNALKHFNDPTEDPVEADYPEEAWAVLMRAVGNYISLFGLHESPEAFSAFWSTPKEEQLP